MLDGSQNWSGCCGEDSLTPPGEMNLNFSDIQPIAHHCAILAPDDKNINKKKFKKNYFTLTSSVV
jgi:hypothetical protein